MITIHPSYDPIARVWFIEQISGSSHHLPTHNFKVCMGCGRTREEIESLSGEIVEKDSEWKKSTNRCTTGLPDVEASSIRELLMTLRQMRGMKRIKIQDYYPLGNTPRPVWPPVQPYKYVPQHRVVGARQYDQGRERCEEAAEKRREELRTDAPAIEEKKSRTDAPAIEEKKSRTDAPAIEEKKSEHTHHRVIHAKREGSRGYKYDHDKILDLWASGLVVRLIVEECGLSSAKVVSQVLDKARKRSDERAVRREKKSKVPRQSQRLLTVPPISERRDKYDRILDLWSTTDLTHVLIAERTGVTVGTVSGLIARGRRAGDLRAERRSERELKVNSGR